MNKLLYKENIRIRTPEVIYYDGFRADSNGILTYANRWIEYDTNTTKYTPCKWGQRLQPCDSFERATKEMIAFEVIQRLESA
jgi:hypothetical protein